MPPIRVRDELYRLSGAQETAASGDLKVEYVFPRTKVDVDVFQLSNYPN